MESLRKQLAETQDALHKKTTQVRELRVKQAEELNAWKLERNGFDARVRQLEAEVQRLRQGNGVTGGSSAKLSLSSFENMLSPKLADKTNAIVKKDTVVDDDDETVTISRARMREAEETYKNVVKELAEKTKLCDSIQRRFSPPSCSVKIPDFNVTDDWLILRWEKLRGLVRSLAVERFNKTVQAKLVPEKSKTEFEALTKHWKSYISNDKLTNYIFRALIWRYLNTCLFRKYWHMWGKQHGDAGVNLGNLFSTKASDEEFHNWRIHTLRLFHKSCQVDSGMLTDVTNKIFEALRSFATGIDSADLKMKVSEIVAAAAEFSTIFGRSYYQALMTDKPHSPLNYGFPYKPETMEVKGNLGSQLVVDLMITPCLLKRDPDYSVLVKADIIC
ncbi:hypothetical protein F5B19DRAFT_434468 [Rostrohypoxylon terebratum]|nr:hypothetical protein F5B19DRAFT_434468 [Rostrohypoxylon terebratum]